MHEELDLRSWNSSLTIEITGVRKLQSKSWNASRFLEWSFLYLNGTSKRFKVPAKANKYRRVESLHWADPVSLQRVRR